MSLSFIFWLLMLLALVLGWSGHSGFWVYGYFGSGLFLFIELCLLGYKVFGSPIKDSGPVTKD